MTETGTETGVWSRFWDQPRFSTRALALTRMVVSPILILFALQSARPFVRAPQEKGFADVFHLPYAAWIPALPYRAMTVMYALVAVCGLLAFLGVATRATFLGAGVLVILGLLQDRLAFVNHHHHLAVLSILLAFMPCSDRWSVAAWWKQRQGVAPPRPDATSWAARLLQLTTSLVYLASALGKTNSPWWSGDLLAATQIANADAGVRGGLHWAVGVASPATWARLALATEYFLVFGLWYRRTRLLALATGVVFHLAVETGLAVGTFTWQVLASYLLFAGERPRGDGPARDNRREGKQARS